MLPSDLVNRSLDAIGSELVIGEIENGSREAQVALRHYGPCLRQLTRAAHWDTHRKQAPLQILADATGNTPDAGTQVPIPWTYEYALPIDCMKSRFVPINNFVMAGSPPSGNISLPQTPQTTGPGAPPTNVARIRPARFTVATDFNYPIQTGSDWGQGAQWWDVQGVGPQERTVILTNVKNAQLVYTALLVYPNLWDALFEAAMVAMLAQEIALPVLKDKKFALAVRAQQIAITKEKIQQARITDGNEGWYTNDHMPDWMRTRNSGGWGRGWGGGEGYGEGAGVLGYGYDSCSFSDGSAY